jgi:hypothetical protein
MELGMSRSDTVELAELLHLIERKVESGKMQPCVEEHAAVTCREDETIAIDPAGSRRIDLEGLTEEDGPDVSRAKWETKVPGLACSDSIDGESPGITGG